MILKEFDTMFFLWYHFFMKDKPKFTPKQEMFCHEYLIDLNGTQAAIRAGYSEVSARQIADDNLSKHDIKEYIEKLKVERQEKTQITAEWVLKEAEYCYNALKQQNAHKDALNALKLIGEHTNIKAFDKNVNVNHQGNQNLTVTFVQADQSKDDSNIDNINSR